MEFGKFGPCAAWCCCGNMVLMRAVAVGKYGIIEDGCMTITLACCFPWCSYFQVAHEIMAREQLSWGCTNVVPDASKRGNQPAQAVTMSRP